MSTSPASLPLALERQEDLLAALDADCRRPVFFLDYGTLFSSFGEERFATAGLLCGKWEGTCIARSACEAR